MKKQESKKGHILFLLFILALIVSSLFIGFGSLVYAILYNPFLGLAVFIVSCLICYLSVRLGDYLVRKGE